MSIFSLFRKNDKPIHINAPIKEHLESPRRSQKRNVVRYNEPKHIVTKRKVMTRGVPADYFFGGNNKIKCTILSVKIYEGEMLWKTSLKVS